MPVDLIWSPTALAHLRAIYDYIVAENPVAALEVQDAIEQDVGRLQEHPRLGRPGWVRATRELVIAAYPASIVVYEIARQAVHILAVMHGKQQWPTRFGDREA
jgi:toxin ParE1/3/4